MSRTLLVSISLLCTVGCASGTLLRRTPRMGSATAIATSADVRVITTTPVTMKGNDFVDPAQIVCAEPSPDVAKIVSEAFGSSGALGVRARGANLPASGDLNTTLALSKSYAEGIAQMTERLATIQLLRDGLYRACEAYANGAISATTYSAMVSRFDKTMITMLMGELAAGNFGRSLAALAGTTSAKSSAELALEEVKKREQDAKENLERKQERKESIEDKLVATPSTPENAAQREELRTASKEAGDEVKTAKEEHRKAEDQLKQTLKAMAETSASTSVTAAGSIQRTAPEAAAAIAADLVQIQANYLNDHNVDAVKIACLNSFGREDGVVTAGADGSPFKRALSVWCNSIVDTLKEEAKALRAVRNEHASPESRPVEPMMKALFMAEPQAVGPFDVEWQKVELGKEQAGKGPAPARPVAAPRGGSVR